MSRFGELLARKFNIDTVYVSADYVDLSTALYAIGSKTATLLVDSPLPVTTNVTVPPNVTLWFHGRGALSINAGVTLVVDGSVVIHSSGVSFTGSGSVTLNGPLEAPLTWIFDSTVSVTFGTTGRMGPLYPQWFGAVGDGVADDTVPLQRTFDAAVGRQLKVVLPRAAYRTTATLTISTAYYDEFVTEGWGEIRSEVPAGTYAIVLYNCLYSRFHFNLRSTGNGLKVTFHALFNTISGSYWSSSGRAATKPALGSGSIGILLDNPGTHAIYFNHLVRPIVREFDTAIWVSHLANANIIDEPHFQDYWYGIVLDGGETYVNGGFGHHAFGAGGVYTEAFHLTSNASFNVISGTVLEPGPSSVSWVADAGAERNVIDVMDNTSFKFIDDSAYGLGDAQLNKWREWFYEYQNLAEGTYYRASKLTNVGPYWREEQVRLFYSSYNAATGGIVSGRVTASVRLTTAGSITVSTLEHVTLTQYGYGAAEFRGWDVVSATEVAPVFYVTSGGTNTTTCVLRLWIDLGQFHPAVRLLETTVAPAAQTPPLEVKGDRVNLLKELAIPVVPTASLPAAGAAQNGRILIEDGGAGVGNLILYKGGQRFRITGTSF